MKEILTFLIFSTLPTACKNSESSAPDNSTLSARDNDRLTAQSHQLLPPQDSTLDRDNDGLPDSNDLCPTDAERRNGFQDHDGCPDEIPDELKRALEPYQYSEQDAVGLQTQGTAHDSLRAVLHRLGLMMGKYPDVEVEVRVHCGSTGSLSYGRDPTQALAAAIKKYLIAEEAIEQSRIWEQGVGADEPLDPGDSEIGRNMNRRIEFSLIVR